MCDYYGMLLSAGKAGKIKEQNPHKADAESFLSAVSGQEAVKLNSYKINVPVSCNKNENFCIKRSEREFD